MERGPLVAPPQEKDSLKDVTPLTLKASVIYSFDSSSDKNHTYICKTTNHLTTRVTRTPLR